ncbi:unnamed protein product [Echinostoma caproni]|uniref:DUF4158 domain-containing protein n=1 Tax=Echinostoma caproni TaxID=27848 RepID=A0A183BH21_9TREM|nr:unnamed protein product [Echinostoma caproni]
MPENDPYTQLKEAFITCTIVWDERRLDELFGDLKIGNRTLSQLLRHMRQLLRPRVLDRAFLSQLWLERLPPRIREVFVVSGSRLITIYTQQDITR